MKPYKVVINTTVGNLRFLSGGTKQTYPVLSCNYIVWVNSCLCTVQSIKELLPLLCRQGVDILPDNRWLPHVALGAGPAKLAVTTVIASKVS